MDALNALPDDIKKIVLEDTKYYLAGTISMIEILQQQYVIAKSIEEYGIEHWVWSADEQRKARKIASDEVWPFYGAKSPLSQELLNIIMDYQKHMGLL